MAVLVDIRWQRASGRPARAGLVLIAGDDARGDPNRAFAPPDSNQAPHSTPKPLHEFSYQPVSAGGMAHTHGLHNTSAGSIYRRRWKIYCFAHLD
ncbi:unnamed protein product [Leptosia nina]|uniref:Uncharacterized protein n=1 Tax=Leptosia nina TaxID=320188 RepID=A0AAV1JUG7_9NEOP